MKSKFLFVIFITAATTFFAQEIDIIDALSEVESGNMQNANSYLNKLKNSNPNDPSVIFLNGILTQNGDEALKKYSAVYEKYPKSKYADASLYKIFSYYYALGYYNKAADYLTKLKTEFPNSPYIKTADRTIPDDEETTPISDIQIEPKPVTENYKYTIQAGAFLNADNAKKLCDQLLSDEYETEIITKDIGGSVFNIVIVGKFKTEIEVNQFLKTLSDVYQLKGRIVKINKAE